MEGEAALGLVTTTGGVGHLYQPANTEDVSTGMWRTKQLPDFVHHIDLATPPKLPHGIRWKPLPPSLLAAAALICESSGQGRHQLRGQSQVNQVGPAPCGARPMVLGMQALEQVGEQVLVVVVNSRYLQWHPELVSHHGEVFTWGYGTQGQLGRVKPYNKTSE